MTVDRLRAILSQHDAELQQYQVASLAVFGSVARGESGPASDVDLLVEFRRPIGLFHFVRLQRRLSELLGARVDLVEPEALKPQLRARIVAEAVHAA